MLRLLGILRSQTFSPAQHAENDRLILELTAEELRRAGCSVELCTEEEVAGGRPIDAPVVFSMCQGVRANEALLAVERRGALIINSPRAVLGCHRQSLGRLNGRGGELLAPLSLLSVGEDRLLPSFSGSWWVKRGDVHSTGPGDVVRVESVEGLAGALHELRQRHVKWAVVQPHLEGTVVKFYGVVGTPFFRYYTEDDFQVAPLAMEAHRAGIERLAHRVGLVVYGGDAVLDADGRAQVIDLNDWPSFAYFRTAAARVIGQRILAAALAHVGEQRQARPAVGPGSTIS